MSGLVFDSLLVIIQNPVPGSYDLLIVLKYLVSLLSLVFLLSVYLKSLLGVGN